jgi:hypothetical protein
MSKSSGPRVIFIILRLSGLSLGKKYCTLGTENVGGHPTLSISKEEEARGSSEPRELDPRL